MGRVLENPKDRKINHSFSVEDKIRKEFEEKVRFEEHKSFSAKLRELMIKYLHKEEEYGIPKEDN